MEMTVEKSNPIRELGKFGQSVWLDYISREILESGRLTRMRKEGVRGLTSNPTIFEKAVSSGSDYDARIASSPAAGPDEIYETIAVGEIQSAADAFLPVYRRSEGLDGYVSLEINPRLSGDTASTIQEGLRLHRKVARPNLMLKVPATREGFPAIEEFTARGISVNATLIFSRSQYEKTAAAYISGLKRLYEKKIADGRLVRSVASVFVSRVDTVVDRMLDERIAAAAGPDRRAFLASLKGKAAVANCARIYGRFQDIFSSGAFERLKREGANPQRVLWASTSTKNPAYSDLKYVSELIAPDTVNTMPEATYAAFLDHGTAAGQCAVLPREDADGIIGALRTEGIDLDIVCDRLLREGVQAFVQSIDSLLACLRKKAECLSRPRVSGGAAVSGDREAV